MTSAYGEMKIKSHILTTIGEALTREELVVLSTRVSDLDQHTQQWIANQVEAHEIRERENK